MNEAAIQGDTANVANVARHEQRALESGAVKPSGYILGAVGVIGLGAFFLVLFFMLHAPSPLSRADQIMEGCKREFASEGKGRVNACAIQIMTDELAQRERDKLRRAAQ